MLSDKVNIIQDQLLPDITESIDLASQVALAETKELVNMIAKLDSEEVVLQRAAAKLKKGNEQLEEAIPQIDDQIEQALKLLDELETFDVDAEQIMSDVMVPKSEIKAKLIKCQCKDEALQATLQGYKAVKEIEDVDSWIG